MSEANVIFTLDGVNLTIKCTTEDKMKDICKNYSKKINKNLNSLLFLYGRNKVNFDLSFKEQANILDRNNHEMKIFVNEKEDNIMICSKCGAKIALKDEKLDEIILYNEEIKNTIIGIKLQIDNIINAYSNNSFNYQLKNINRLLILIKEDIKKIMKI